MRTWSLLVFLTLGNEGEAVYQNVQVDRFWQRSNLGQALDPYVAKPGGNFYQIFNQGKPQTFNGANDRYGKRDEPDEDYHSSYSVNLVGPSQLETIQSKHYHKKVPEFDVSDFQYDHQASEKHAEVHYHQHKHIHKHEHKQDHVHQHKNQHDHKHMHQQHHKHKHHSDHKHGHDHKHNHHQNHKHDHQHKHNHGHHQHHNHGHHHGHKHQHHVKAKHGHQHGHGKY